MIANYGGGASTFGSGCLLDDLVRFVYGGRGCRLMLIGDCAQLPPVGEQESPALQDDVLERMGLRAYSCDLDEVLRQGEDLAFSSMRRLSANLSPATQQHCCHASV